MPTRKFRQGSARENRVFDMEGNPVLVITVTDREDRLPAAWSGTTAEAVAKAARDLTLRLGGRTVTRT